MKFCLLFFFLCLKIVAAESKGLQVQGHCKNQVIPDRGLVTFTAENQSKQQQEAVKKTNQQMSELREKLSELKLAHLELKTSNYSVFPIREYEKDRYVEKGVKASMTLEVTTSEIPRLGEALVVASQVGLRNVGALNIFLSLEKSQEEYLKCLDIAASDAKKKAEQLAKRLGVSVGKVRRIIETPALATRLYQPEHSFVAKTMLGTEASSVDISPGTQIFSTTIQVTFEIK